MKFLKIFIGVLLFASKSFAFEGYDECGNFKKYAQEEIPKFKDDFPWQNEESFGFTYNYEISDEKKVTDFYLEKVYGQFYSKNGLDRFETFDTVDLLNGQDPIGMTEEQLLDILAEDTITVKDSYYDEDYVISKKTYKVLDLAVNPEISVIYDILPKNEYFKSNLVLNYWFLDHRFLEIARRVFKEAVESDPSALKDPDANGFYCDLKAEFFESIGAIMPILRINGFRSDIDPSPIKYTVSYETSLDPDTLNLHEHVLDYQTKVDLLVENTVEAVFVFAEQPMQGSITNNYDLKNFPFDRQYLDFGISPVEQWMLIEGDYRIDVGYTGEDYIESTYVWNENSEWSFDYASWLPITSYSTMSNAYIPTLEIYFEISRHIEYYVFKLFLPIVLLLTLTWSIFWINPSDLETRVTISIVTFLALIAYNFVIDNDLAKLAYLTFLDVVILVSYFFAGLPTFVAILCKNLIQKENPETGYRINSISKVLFPVMYFLSLNFVVIYFEIIQDFIS